MMVRYLFRCLCGGRASGGAPIKDAETIRLKFWEIHSGEGHGPYQPLTTQQRADLRTMIRAENRRRRDLFMGGD